MLVALNVVYVLVAIAMIALILMQRGAGAQAGSGFGAGASATVFGATGAGNFLTKATKWLAIVFFAISMYMAWHATNSAAPVAESDLGVMGSVAEVPAAAPAADAAQVPAAPVEAEPLPAAPVQQAPAVEGPATEMPPAEQATDTPEPEPAPES